MKYKVIILTITTLLLFTGCTIKKEASAVYPRHYNAHSVLYEVQYDTQCSDKVELQTRIFTLKKGQRLLPKNFANLKIDGSTFKAGTTLSEDAVGLFLGIISPADWYYLVIKQDGSFALDDHFMIEWKPNGIADHTYTLEGDIKDGLGCKLVNGQPLFKAIRR